MIYIDFKESNFNKYHKIIKCWLLIKIDGRKSNKNKNGHICENNKCEICSTTIYKFKDMPKAVINFIKRDDIIDDLIIGKPSKLVEIYKEYKELGINDKKIISDFFTKTGYKNWFQSEFAKDFLSDLNINTCVYCNRNYTLDILDTHTRAELDHWFPKDKFPILALSLFNLIPSCHSCNHIKGNGNKNLEKILKNGNLTDEEIKKWWIDALDNMNHPYDMKEDENFTFSYEFNEDLDSLSVKFKINPNSKKTSKTLEFNKTSEIYSAHTNFELKDLLDLRYKYSKNYLDILNKTFEGLNLSKEEAYRMIFGIEIKEENYHKRPFSKFKNDIIEELKNIK